MPHLKHVLHSRAFGSRRFGSLEILRRSEMTDELARMQVTGRLNLRDLRALLPEQSSMRTLRAAMRETRGIGVHHRSDREVLAWFAGQIAAGRLTLVATPTATPHAGASAETLPASAPAEPQADAPPPRTAPAPSPPPPQRAPAPTPPRPPPQTFKHVDQDLQAVVLEAAARAGTPFCEECNRLAS